MRVGAGVARRITNTPRRHFTPPAIGMNHAIQALQNGILGGDDFLRHGLPASPYQFAAVSGGLTVEQICQQHSHVDPYATVREDMRSMADNLKSLVGSDHPVLRKIAAYFFDIEGKRIRPTILFLVCRALSLLSPQSLAAGSTSSAPVMGHGINPDQRRLSEITEVIHTASLLHDDVIDDSDKRRGAKSVNGTWGNKLAILGGDFLLARASLALAKLRNSDVTELVSTVLEHLVKGEVMQMKSLGGTGLSSHLEYYLTKSYYKTASLIARSCKAVAILGSHDPKLQEIAYEYGKNIGLAFQIVDDILDFTGQSAKTGKPALNDIEHGVVTAPILFAAEEHPALEEMIQRKFSEPGDVEKAMEMINNSAAIARATQLATSCAENAIAAIMQLPPSVPRSGLIHLVDMVLKRDK